MFFRPAPDPPDVIAVVEASSLLAISEFRLFELAYRNWYGVEGDVETIEGSFFPYMFQNQVPHFVRAFTRRVGRLERSGRLDPRDFGIEPEGRTLGGVATGLACALGIVVALFVLVTLANVTAERLGLAECLFPPCF